MNRITQFFRLSGREKMLFTEALMLEIYVGLLLKIIPFRWIPRLFASDQPAVGNPQPAVLELIRTAIQRAAGVSPWKNKCLISSLAGRCMLRRRKIPSQLSLGVILDGNRKMIAHAWLKASDFEVVDKRGDFRELYLF